jgi:hypothetical protein
MSRLRQVPLPLLDSGGGQSGLEDDRAAVDPDAKAFWPDAKSGRAQRQISTTDDFAQTSRQRIVGIYHLRFVAAWKPANEFNLISHHVLLASASESCGSGVSTPPIR